MTGRALRRRLRCLLWDHPADKVSCDFIRSSLGEWIGTNLHCRQCGASWTESRP